MKDLCIWLTMLTLVAFATRYSYQIWKRQIAPTPSTWVIFLLGTSLSLVTYAIAEERDFRSGILNTMDTMSVVVVLVALAIWGESGLRFDQFEKWYMGGIGAIVMYGLITGNAWNSNIFTQILITLGYIPTIKKLVEIKRNTESFTAWGLGLTAGFLGLYPAIEDGNSLAILYALRTIACVSCVVTIMAYYKMHPQRKTTE